MQEEAVAGACLRGPTQAVNNDEPFTCPPSPGASLQEAERMNGLLGEMRRSLEELTLGLDGALNMSPAMEALSAALAAGRVPTSWMACMSTRIQV